MNSLGRRLLYLSTTFFLSEAPVLVQRPHVTGWRVSDMTSFLADGKSQSNKQALSESWSCAQSHCRLQRSLMRASL